MLHLAGVTLSFSLVINLCFIPSNESQGNHFGYGCLKANANLLVGSDGNLILKCKAKRYLLGVKEGNFIVGILSWILSQSFSSIINYSAKMQRIIYGFEFFLESLNFSNVHTFGLLRMFLHNVKSRYQLRKQSICIYLTSLLSIILLPPSKNASVHAYDNANGVGLKIGACSWTCWRNTLQVYSFCGFFKSFEPLYKELGFGWTKPNCLAIKFG